MCKPHFQFYVFGPSLFVGSRPVLPGDPISLLAPKPLLYVSFAETNLLFLIRSPARVLLGHTISSRLRASKNPFYFQVS